MKKILIKSFPYLVVSISLVSCKGLRTLSTDSPSQNLNTIASNYYEQYLKFHPWEATWNGDSRYNDQLPIDISKENISKEIDFYSSVQKQLSQINNKSLSDEEKIIYDVLAYTLKDRIESYSYHPEYIPFTQVWGLPIMISIDGSGQGRQPFENEKDYEDWLKKIDKFPLWVDTAIENFKEGIHEGIVLPKKLILSMVLQMKAKEILTLDFEKNNFYGPIRNFPKEFNQIQREKFTKLYQQAILTKIIPAYSKMGGFLEFEYLPKGRDTDGYNSIPKGDEIYRYLVKSEVTSSVSPEEIHAIGLLEVAVFQKQMEEIKQQTGFTGTLEEFLSFVKTDPKTMPYKSSEEVLAGFRKVLVKITPKLKTMFDITPKTKFEIRQVEKFREKGIGAHYFPGTSDGKKPGIFYIPIPDPSKYNIASGMESLFLHEAIPGHHYQYSVQRENTKLPNFMRYALVGGAYVEGWGLYCETLGFNLGLYTDTYQKIGYLNMQLLRAVRLVIDTGLHTGKMNREEAIKYFLSNTSYSEAEASKEVERYMAIPGQALAYKIGALRILELRARYEKELGTKFNLVKFHNEILSDGPLPLDVLTEKMELWAKKQKK